MSLSEKFSDEIWKADQAAAYLRISKDLLYELVRANEIPYLRLGRCLRFRRSDLEAL